VSSLARGDWVKLICGASNQDVPLIRNLCFVYTLAGVDCIDLSVDPAVVAAARGGVDAALTVMSDSMGDFLMCNLQQQEQQSESRVEQQRPLIMVSVNDDEDLHFRKAKFDVTKCPSDCPRPCEKVCPAVAIPSLAALSSLSPSTSQGVVADRCYGCGRCVPICPLGLIDTESYITNRTTIENLFQTGAVDAIEIHTSAGHEIEFAALWSEIGPSVLPRATVVAVSFPNMGNDTLPYLQCLSNIIHAQPEATSFEGVQIWQADGRPMSGDIGKGTTHATSELAAKILSEVNSKGTSINFSSNKHFVQLAGGTNEYSATAALAQGLIGAKGFGGFAFGGYARKAIGAHLRTLEEEYPGAKLEDHPDALRACLDVATHLVATVKR